MSEPEKPKKRRPKGDGAEAYQVPDGRWRAEVDLGVGANGKRRRKVVYGATRAEANRALRDAVRQKEDGVLSASRPPTLQAWLDHWLTTIAPTSGRVRPRTMVGYRSYIRVWVEDKPLGKVRLDKLKPEHFELAYAGMRELGKSESTIAQLHRILHRALKIAVQRQRIATNPTDRMDGPQAAAFEPQILTTADAKKLVRAAVTDQENGARWLLSLAMGPRQGEVLGLAWDKMDLDGGKLSIHRELFRLPWQHGCPGATEKKPSCGGKRGADCPKRHGGGLYLGEPKSKAGKRDVPLPDDLVKAFRVHRREQLRIRAEEGDRWAPFTSANGETVDLVFSQRNGKALDARKDHAAWKKFLADNGVDEVRVHDSRHTAATVLLLMGVPGRVVMDIMGWSQMSMLTRYQHVLDEMKVDAARKIGNALWSPDPEPEPEPEPEPVAPSAVVDFAAFRKRRSG